MKTLSLLAIVLLLAGCAETEFLPYQGNAVRTGMGGAVKTVNGIELWEDGSPPRKFRVIGVIHDDRRENDMNHYERKVAKVASEHGGDAVIFMSTRQVFSGETRAHRLSEALVVKYL